MVLRKLYRTSPQLIIASLIFIIVSGVTYAIDFPPYVNVLLSILVASVLVPITFSVRAVMDDSVDVNTFIGSATVSTFITGIVVILGLLMSYFGPIAIGEQISIGASLFLPAVSLVWLYIINTE